MLAAFVALLAAQHQARQATLHCTTALHMAPKKAIAPESDYWIDGCEDVDIIDDERGKSIKFTIGGNPKVLKRHRSARGFVYNPSRASQEMFRDCLLELLPQQYHPTIIDSGEVDDEELRVTFPSHEFLKMSITFRMKRPNNHFIGNKRGQGRLKPTAPRRFHNSRGDIDNFCKFVMDSLNQVLYTDDKQVVCLNAIRVLDSIGDCNGATTVEISVLHDDDVGDEYI